jgi:hypothetical protein
MQVASGCPSDLVTAPPGSHDLLSHLVIDGSRDRLLHGSPVRGSFSNGKNDHVGVASIIETRSPSRAKRARVSVSIIGTARNERHSLGQAPKGCVAAPWAARSARWHWAHCPLLHSDHRGETGQFEEMIDHCKTWMSHGHYAQNRRLNRTREIR